MAKNVEIYSNEDKKPAFTILTRMHSFPFPLYRVGIGRDWRVIEITNLGL